MIQVQIDEQQVFEIAREEIKTKLKTIESEFIFWDLKTLCEKTCMSRSFVLETFFFLPDFPRHKVGTKWVIPAKEASEYLLQWLKHQPCS
ncbi:group-specific protein [Sporosarcina sp. FSL K6-1522]|uniref:group-specific protein n=1 Tax=Sporosarcina sp. FSL K6-1522 TaxID=2921554 RepID=UPI00315AF870